MLKKDFDLFKQKYIQNCKTESSNSAILELYSFILKNEVVDSDVWSVGGGNDDVIRILEYCFSEKDWKELESEIESWTTNQLEIFTESILEGSGQNENDELNSTVENRFRLLKKLLIIAKERDILRNDILLSLLNNIEFLNKCKLIKLEEAIEIANYFNYFERIKTEIDKDDLVMITLKTMMEKASS
jgi:hypothetical protein